VVGAIEEFCGQRRGNHFDEGRAMNSVTAPSSIAVLPYATASAPALSDVMTNAPDVRQFHLVAAEVGDPVQRKVKCNPGAGAGRVMVTPEAHAP